MKKEDNKSKKDAVKKGEKSASTGKEPMADSGSKSGKPVSKDKEHMADSGRKGGKH